MDYMSLLSNMPSGFWETIIGWFLGFIQNYGWTIIVFTICLKIVMLPLDFFQKKITRDNAKKQAILKPELDKLKEKYGNNQEEINKRTMELYKRENYNIVGGCVGMLVNMVLTMAIFFTLFAAMNNVSQFKIKEEYATLEQTYVVEYEYINAIDNSYDLWEDYVLTIAEARTSAGIKYDASPEIYEGTKEEYLDHVELETINEYKFEYAQNKVNDKFKQIKNGWLWVKNIFRPDTLASTFPNYNDYINLTGFKFTEKTEMNGEIEVTFLYKSPISNVYFTTETDANDAFSNDYNFITSKVQAEYGQWNGYYILIILAAGTTLLGQLLMNAGTKAKNKKGQEVKVQSAQTNKLLMILMPAVMIFFTIGYSAAFALYIIVSSGFSALASYLLNLLFNKMDEIKENKNVVKIDYSRKGAK